MKINLFLSLLLCISLIGCGSGGISENSGSIKMGDLSYTNGVASSTATYTSTAGTVLPNQKIVFSWRTVGVSSATIVDYPPIESRTDGTGTASSDLTLPVPITEDLVVYVRATTGDVSTPTQSIKVLK